MTRPQPPGTDLLVLHALRCIGFAGPERVATATGLPEADVESELIDLAVAGLVGRVAGDFGGWGLTDAGRTADAEQIAAELDAAGTRTAVAAAYDDFLVLNPELLDLCAAWQTRPSTVGRPSTSTSTLPTTLGYWTGSPTSTGVPRSSARPCPRRCPGSGAIASGWPTPSPAPGRVRWST
jgi:hypothetical protein